MALSRQREGEMVERAGQLEPLYEVRCPATKPLLDVSLKIGGDES